MIFPLLFVVAATASVLKLLESVPAAHRSNSGTTSIGGVVGQVGATSSGRVSPLLRLEVRVPKAHVDRTRATFGANGQKALLVDVERRILTSGFRGTEAVMQDPTNPERFTVLARRDGGPARVDPLAQIVRAEVVEEIPVAALPVGTGARILDPGLTEEELQTIRYALVNEENPRHLGGLAYTLEPYFPVASSLLRARSTLLEAAQGTNTERLARTNHGAALAVKKVVEEKAPGEGEKVFRWLVRGPGEPNATSVLQRATRGEWPDVEAEWSVLCRRLPAQWFGLDKMRAILREESAAPRSFEEIRADLEKYARETGMPLEVLRDEVRRAASLCVEEPSNLMGTEREMPVRRVRLRSFPPIVQEAARRMVREIGLGLWIVDEDAVRRMLAPDPAERAFVSPSALQLALAASKPVHAGVGSAAVAGNVLANLNAGLGAEPSKVMRAQAQMERANRAIERRRWIEWYRRAASL